MACFIHENHLYCLDGFQRLIKHNNVIWAGLWNTWGELIKEIGLSLQCTIIILFVFSWQMYEATKLDKTIIVFKTYADNYLTNTTRLKCKNFTHKSPESYWSLQSNRYALAAYAFITIFLVVLSIHFSNTKRMQLNSLLFSWLFKRVSCVKRHLVHHYHLYQQRT